MGSRKRVYPETRGSHIASALERERAMKKYRRLRLRRDETLIVEVEEESMRRNANQVELPNALRAASSGPCGLQHFGKPDCRMLLVAPKMAEEMLGKNTRNRSLCLKTIDRIVRDIDSGRYVVNGSGIQFTKSWVLADGQHRLHAIVKSGKAILLVVAVGLEEDVIRVLDDGRKRSFRDQKVIDGTPDPKRVAVFTRAAFNAANNFNRQPSNSELDALYNYAQDGIDWLTDVVKAPSTFSSLPAEVAGALVWAWFENPEEVDSFARMVWTGDGIGASNGARCLNNQMKSWSNKNTTRAQKQRMTLRCLAAHIDGERLTVPKAISDEYGERLHARFIPKARTLP